VKVFFAKQSHLGQNSFRLNPTESKQVKPSQTNFYLRPWRLGGKKQVSCLRFLDFTFLLSSFLISVVLQSVVRSP
jgi:hypothetical protein